MRKYVIHIFGLDQKLFEIISHDEQSKFSKAFIFLFLVLLISFFSTVWGGFRISGSWILGGIIGSIFTYVFFSIYRFTIISIKLPLAGDFFDEVKKRSLKEIKLKVEEDDEIMDLKKSLTQKTKLVSTNVKKRLNLNIGVVVRTFIFCVLMQIPIFFTVALLQLSQTETITKVKRVEVEKSYQVVLLKAKKTELSVLHSKKKVLKDAVESSSTLNSSNSITFRNKEKQLYETETEIRKREKYWASEYKKRIDKFRVAIKDDFYVAPLIDEYFGHTFYNAVELFFLVICFVPVRIFRALRKKSEKYTYNLKLAEKHRNEVLRIYNDLESFKKKRCKHYGIPFESHLPPYLDPPFNTKKNLGFVRKKDIDIADYYAN